MRQEIRICGFGGQGIILAGVILGESATRAGLKAVQTQSYGPESRGGAARSEVIISDGVIDYPRVTRANVIVALSQPSFDKYSGDLIEGGVVIVDEDLVEAESAVGQPFQRVAEGIGYKIVTNIVMLGYLGAYMGLVPEDVFEMTVIDNVPKGTEELNRKALAAGRELFTKGGPA